MTGVYRTAKGWRIFIYIFGPLFILLFMYLGILPFVLDEFSWFQVLFWVPISAGMIALFGYGIIDTATGRFVIESDKIATISPLNSRQLKYEEIKGFREDDNYIHFIPIDRNTKRINVSVYTEKIDQIRAWCLSRFHELDEAEVLEGRQTILESNEFGINRQTREFRLHEASRICKIANATGFILLLWIAFYPKPYLTSLSIALAYPIFILLLLFLYRGLIRMDERRNSAYPTISSGFIMVAIGLSLRAIVDYNISDYSNVWMVTSIFSAILLLIVLLGSKKLNPKDPQDYLHLLGVIASVWIFSFGSYIIANCMYDTSPPRIFETQVVDKEINTGTPTTYYLQINPWTDKTETEKIKVDRDEYNATSIGGSVEIYEMRGLLETPWFYISVE